jgi:hypothetical protein
MIPNNSNVLEYTIKINKKYETKITIKLSILHLLILKHVLLI